MQGARRHERRQGAPAPVLGRALRGAALALATSCSPGPVPPDDAFQGYIEGEFAYIASPFGGRLDDLAVTRGQTVAKGDLLFQLAGDPEAKRLEAATRRREAAAATLEDLRKGKRPSEIDALEAALAEAAAESEYWTREADRRQGAFAQRSVSAAELDHATSQRDQARNRVGILTAQLATAKLGGRSDTVTAAEAELAAAVAAENEATWALSEKTRQSPADAIVQDTLFLPGEWVAADRPVVVLLSPGDVRARFFVPEPLLSRVAPGDLVDVEIDGRTDRIPARIARVSSEAEFTPPVIFSRETRAKLVFLVEATFDEEAAAGLRPGQPVSVRLPPQPADDPARE